MRLPKPKPCLTFMGKAPCPGTLLPITDRKWRCTEGHTMYGTSALKSEPWPLDRLLQAVLDWHQSELDSHGNVAADASHQPEAERLHIAVKEYYGPDV